MATTASTMSIIHFFPYIGSSLYFKIFYFNGGELSASNYVTNGGTSVQYGQINIALVNGVLKITPSSNYNLYEL